MSTEEKLILFEYEMYSEKEYRPMSYSDFVTKKLIEAREELSKLHQPTVSESVCECRRIGQWSIQEMARNSCSTCEKPIRQTGR